MVNPTGGHLTGSRYEIVVRGRLGGALIQALDGLDLLRSGADATHLSGWFVDQAALYGVLRELGDLGLELCSVRRLPERR